MFALALQTNPDLTYDEFVEVCEKTVNVNEEGIRLINPIGIINEVKLMNEEKRGR